MNKYTKPVHNGISTYFERRRNIKKENNIVYKKNNMYNRIIYIDELSYFNFRKHINENVNPFKVK